MAERGKNSKNAGLLYKNKVKFSKFSCLHGLGGVNYLNFSVLSSFLAISGEKWRENSKNARRGHFELLLPERICPKG